MAENKGVDTHPAHTLKNGLVSAAIWRDGNDQTIVYNVTFARAYQKPEGGWGDSRSFSRNELVTVAKLALEAHTWIGQQQRAELAAGKPPSPEDPALPEAEDRTADLADSPTAAGEAPAGASGPRPTKDAAHSRAPGTGLRTPAR